MSDLTRLTATALSARIAAGEVSSVDACTAYLDRIEAENPRLNALVSLRPREDVVADAAAADRAPRRGWLHGLPMAPKDLTETAGLTTTYGSALFAGNVPSQDSLLAARLRAAGAIFVGKSNTPEFGLGSHTFNEVFGATRNVADPALSAGGSSGGAAVALAARMVPVADGSDMMGSLRNPAAWAGVYGFRPSFGLVPNDGPGDLFMATLATDGPMGRTVEDVARLLEVIAGPSPASPFGRPAEPFAAVLHQPPERLRIGWLGDWGGAWAMEPGLLPACEAALARMEADLGATVVPLPPPFPAEALWQAWVVLRGFQIGHALGPLADGEGGGRLKPELLWEIAEGRARSAAEVHAASVTRSRWFAQAARVFAEVDLIALPATQVWPFPVGRRFPEDIGGRTMDTYHRWMECVIPASLAGLPTLAVPVAAEPLPAGMQLAGPVGADARVLRFGHAWNSIETVSAFRRGL